MYKCFYFNQNTSIKIARNIFHFIKLISFDFFEIKKINESSNLKHTYIHIANDVTHKVSRDKKKEKIQNFVIIFFLLYTCLENRKEKKI